MVGLVEVASGAKAVICVLLIRAVVITSKLVHEKADFCFGKKMQETSGSLTADDKS